MFGFWKKKKKEPPQVVCSKCGASNPADARFCQSCGDNIAEQKKIQEKVDEATEITEDFKDKGGFWAKIIPGYHGYKEKEIRRESDKLLRTHLVKVLQRAKDRLQEMQEEIAEEVPDFLSKSEDMLTELDTLVRKIEHADYGYGALFGSNKIKKAELDKLIDFDRSMVESVMEIESAMKEFAEDVANETGEKIKALRRLINDVRKVFEQRDEYIVGWSPET